MADVVEVLAVAEVAFLAVSGGLVLLVLWLAAPRLVILAGLALPLLGAGVVGLSRMPVSAAGVFLLTLAAGSLIMEIVAAPGLLLHAVGGGLALGMAGVSLIEPGTGAHPGLVVPVAAGTTAVTWLGGRRSWRVAREDPLTDSDRLAGRIATLLDTTDDGRSGHVVVGGSLWTVTCPTGPLQAGCRVHVLGEQDEVLIVRTARRRPP